MFNPFPINVSLPKTYSLNSELNSEKLIHNLADKFEYQIFSFMLVKKICVVYTYSELEKSDDMIRNIIKISDSRPEGKECTERNFEPWRASAYRELHLTGR